MHYLLKITDESGLTTTRTISIFSNTAIQVTEVHPNRGAKSGGKFILIKGRNFSDQTTVTINNEPCTDINVFGSTMLSCLTPAMAFDGPGTIAVQDGMTGASTAAGGLYAYYTHTGLPTDNPCDAPTLVEGGFQQGAGTSANPYLICNAAQLALMPHATTASYILGAHIDLESHQWEIKDFHGVFDGGEYAIVNLRIGSKENPQANHAALFRQVRGGASIKNLRLLNPVVHGTSNNTAVIIAAAQEYNAVTIVVLNVHVMNAIVTSQRSAGGLAGANHNNSARLTITRSSFDGQMTTVNGGSGFVVGGGGSVIYIQDSFTSGEITASSSVRIGSFVAAAPNGDTTIKTSYSTMSLVAPSGTVGGLVAISEDTAINISDSYFAGSVTVPGSVSSVGGILGAATGSKNISLVRVSNLGKITGESKVGGLIGVMEGSNNLSVIDCINHGAIDGNSITGGIIGRVQIQNANAEVRLIRTYNAGQVYCSWDVCGGLFGELTNMDSVLSSFQQQLIEQSYNLGAVYGNNQVGGLIGKDWSSGTYGRQVGAPVLHKVANYGNIFGKENVGGIIGQSRTSGPVDYFSLRYSDILQAGTVTGRNKVAGISHAYLLDYNTDTVSRVVQLGKVQLEDGYTSSNITGFVQTINGSGIFSDNYFNSTVSAFGNETGATGKTAAQLKQQSTYSGFDFDDVWTIEDGESFPGLRLDWDFDQVWEADPSGGRSHTLKDRFDYENIWIKVPGEHPELR